MISSTMAACHCSASGPLSASLSVFGDHGSELISVVKPSSSTLWSIARLTIATSVSSTSFVSSIGVSSVSLVGVTGCKAFSSCHRVFAFLVLP